MSNFSAVKHVYDRLAEGDFRPIFDLLSPDVEWMEAENIPYWPQGPTVGHDAIQRSIFDQLAKDFGHFEINVNRIVDGGATVLVEGRYVGTTRTGRNLDAIYAHIWDFDGGNVVHFQQYSDTWQWRRVLGVDA